MLEHEYARAALKNGLLLESKLGVNPYKFGLVGSTDSHTGLTTAGAQVSVSFEQHGDVYLPAFAPLAASGTK